MSSLFLGAFSSFSLSFAAQGMEPRAVCMPTRHSVLKLYPDPLEPSSYSPIFSCLCSRYSMRSLYSPYNSTPTASCEYCVRTPKPCCPGVSGYELSSRAQWHITLMPALRRQRHRRTSGAWSQPSLHDGFQDSQNYRKTLTQNQKSNQIKDRTS